jgi:hypothetical protein
LLAKQLIFSKEAGTNIRINFSQEKIKQFKEYLSTTNRTLENAYHYRWATERVAIEHVNQLLKPSVS